MTIEIIKNEYTVEVQSPTNSVTLNVSNYAVEIAQIGMQGPEGPAGAPGSANGDTTPYGASWNGSIAVPVQDTVYDKIESLSSLYQAIGSYQPLDGDLTALAALSTNGIVARTASNTFSLRSIIAPAAGISISNGDGVSGNPTLSLSNDLNALESLSGTGFSVRTATDTWTQRTLTGTANQVNVSNGDGVSGDPVLSLPQNIHSGASPTFTGLNLSGLSASLPLKSDGSKNIISAAIDLSSSTEVSNYPKGLIIVKNDDGTQTKYNPASDTDTARGTALVSAFAAHVAGDTIFIGSGSYIVTSTLTPLDGVSIIGQGASTTITGSGLSTPIITVVNNNISIKNLNLRGDTVGIGQINAVDATVSNLLIESVDCQPKAGATYFSGVQFSGILGGGTAHHTVTAVIRSSKLYSYSGGGTGGYGVQLNMASGSIIKVYDCDIFGDTDGVWFGYNGTVNIYGCNVESTLDAITSASAATCNVTVIGTRARGVQSDLYSDNGTLTAYFCDFTVQKAVGNVLQYANNTILGHLIPADNDLGALGTATYSWSDLFLASGGVINFNNGNIKLTHSAGVLTLSGGLFKVNNGSNNYTFGGSTASVTTDNIEVKDLVSSNGYSQFGIWGAATNTNTYYVVRQATSANRFFYGLDSGGLGRINNEAGAIAFFTGGYPGTEQLRVASTGITASNIISITRTTEQLRINYDVSNYYSTTVSSAGAVTFDAVGASASFNFSDQVKITGDLTINPGSNNKINFDRTNTTSYGRLMFSTAGVEKYALGMRGDDATANSLSLTGLDTLGYPRIITCVPGSPYTIELTGVVKTLYNSTNYMTATISSTGLTTFNAAGSGAGFVFSKAVTARINPRVSSTTSSATPTPNSDTDDCYDVTALAANATFGAPTGTPVNFQKLQIRIKDNGTARTLTWNAAYVAGGVALPSTTVLGKILTLGFQYNTANALNKWQLVAAAQEA